MKIRNGFVSNSSSSNFCILGIEVDNKTYSKVSAICPSEKTPDSLDSRRGISCEDFYFIGYCPDKMRDDETLSQFKDRIITEASKIGITIDKNQIDWYIDGGHNG